MTASTYSILANPAVIAISQDSAGTAAVRIWKRPADVDEYEQGEQSLWVMSLSGGDYAIALLNAGNTSMEMSATLEDIFIDKATTGGGATKGSLPSSSGWDIYDLWANRMDDMTANAILQGNATMTTSAANSTTVYNATQTPYADGIKANSTALLGVKTSSVPAMGTVSAMVPRHGIALYRLRKQEAGSQSERDEL